MSFRARALWLCFFLALIGVIVFLFWQWAVDVKIYSLDSGRPGPNVLVIAGTHGNEPAGRVAVQKWLDSCPTVKSGRVFVIPNVNKSGNFLGIRHMLQSPGAPDLNRNYTAHGKDPVSRQVIDLIRRYKIEYILDFHEGWGYHKMEEASVGSTLAPTTPEMRRLAKHIIAHLNKRFVKDDEKHFMINGKRDDKHTLRNYAYRNGVNYILVETTGQNDVQPLSVRCEQVREILDLFLEHVLR